MKILNCLLIALMCVGSAQLVGMERQTSPPEVQNPFLGTGEIDQQAWENFDVLLAGGQLGTLQTGVRYNSWVWSQLYTPQGASWIYNCCFLAENPVADVVVWYECARLLLSGNYSGHVENDQKNSLFNKGLQALLILLIRIEQDLVCLEKLTPECKPHVEHIACVIRDRAKGWIENSGKTIEQLDQQDEIVKVKALCSCVRKHCAAMNNVCNPFWAMHCGPTSRSGGIKFNDLDAQARQNWDELLNVENNPWIVGGLRQCVRGQLLAKFCKCAAWQDFFALDLSINPDRLNAKFQELQQGQPTELIGSFDALDKLFEETADALGQQAEQLAGVMAEKAETSVRAINTVLWECWEAFAQPNNLNAFLQHIEDHTKPDE